MPFAVEKRGNKEEKERMISHWCHSAQLYVEIDVFLITFGSN